MQYNGWTYAQIFTQKMMIEYDSFYYHEYNCILFAQLVVLFNLANTKWEM